MWKMKVGECNEPIFITFPHIHQFHHMAFGIRQTLQFPDPDISEGRCITMVLQPEFFLLGVLRIYG
jgi:hypothetical protein